MIEIIINNRFYKIHPIYTLYAASQDGRIIHIVKQKPQFGNKNKFGYANYGKAIWRIKTKKLLCP